MGVLPVVQGLLNQVVGVLDRPGVSGQAPDQPCSRPGGEPAQTLEPAHEPEQGVGRQRGDGHQVPRPEVSVAIAATGNNVQLAPVLGELGQDRPDCAQGRCTPLPERGRIGRAVAVVAGAEQEGFEVVEIDDQALDVLEQRLEEE